MTNPASSPPATAAAPPGWKRRALLDFWWNLRLFLRWLRPRVANGLLMVLALLVRLMLVCGRHLLRLRPLLTDALRRVRTLLTHARGWILWQWRALRTNPDRRLALLGLLGGFTIPLLLMIGLTWLFPPADPMAGFVDDSVPVPAANFIEASPGEDRSTVTEQVTRGPEPLSPDNFRFELFARRGADGKIQLLSHVAEHYVDSWYPPGTPAVDLMRFFGGIMQRAGSGGTGTGTGTDTTAAARRRCLSMPILKGFTERTVTCTYGHTLPAPLQQGESPSSRVFWIMALSYDSAGKLTDLRIHARLTFAAP